MTATQAGDGCPGGREQQDRAHQDGRVGRGDRRQQGGQTSRGDRVGRGDAGGGVVSLSTLTRLAFLGGPMLSMIDSSVVNIAVPDIVTDLHTSLGTAARPAVIAYSVSAGLALLAASTVGLVLLTAQTPAWLTAVLLCGRGVALGLTVQPLVLALVGDLDDVRMPDANTLFNIAERLSGSFGIALLATFYSTRTQLTGSAVTALHDCALLLAAGSAAGALAALMLRGRTPRLEPTPGSAPAA